MHNPIKMEPSPENIPFKRTICVGSFDDIFLVQLFSIPQHTQARRINSEPNENCRLEPSSKDSKPQEMVTKIIPAHRRGLIFSLNTASATRAVATISKLFKSEAFAAVVNFNPYKRQIGAAISNKIIATI